mmetsp:Transcript_11686/g.25720  ORF Transcript_11686/g.25720 Transcript_11686/m.25720 type:complete len:175 (-) Transcript_11686:260-784(-)
MAQPGTTIQANGFTYKVCSGEFDPRKTSMHVNGKTVNVERESISHIGDRITSTGSASASAAPAAAPVTSLGGQTVTAGNGMTYKVVQGSPDPRQTCVMVNGKTVAVEREAIGRIGGTPSSTGGYPAAPVPGQTVTAGNGMTYKVLQGTPNPRQTCMMVDGKTVAVEREAIGRIG